MFWPGPPEVTRIKFVKAYASEKELEAETPFMEDLLAIVAGRRPPIWRLMNPVGVAISDDGQRLYVSDVAQRMVYRFDFSQKKVKLIGKEERLFNMPLGIALDGEENLYVVDTVGQKVVVIDRQGRPVRKIAEPTLERPTGIAIDRKRGRLYVSNTSHQSSTNHCVYVFDLEGRMLGKVGKGKGADHGNLLFPTYLAVDPAGNLYVSDTMNARVQVFDPEGKYLRTVGDRGDVAGSFSRPKGVALDSFGNLYVADSDWANVQIFNPKGQALLFFGGRGRYPGLLNNPSGIAIDTENKIYVADTQNLRVTVYQLVNTKAEDSLIEPITQAANKDHGKQNGSTK